MCKSGPDPARRWPRVLCPTRGPSRLRGAVALQYARLVEIEYRQALREETDIEIDLHGAERLPRDTLGKLDVAMKEVGRFAVVDPAAPSVP